MPLLRVRFIVRLSWPALSVLMTSHSMAAFPLPARPPQSEDKSRPLASTLFPCRSPSSVMCECARDSGCRGRGEGDTPSPIRELDFAPKDAELGEQGQRQACVPALKHTHQ